MKGERKCKASTVLTEDEKREGEKKHKRAEKKEREKKRRRCEGVCVCVVCVEGKRLRWCVRKVCVSVCVRVGIWCVGELKRIREEWKEGR